MLFLILRGARHGLTMSAKLARLEQQEQEFMAKYGKKKQVDNPAPTEMSSASDQERADKTKQKKAKKKKQHLDELKENGVQDKTEASQEHNEEKSRKRKKRSKDKANLEAVEATRSFVDTDLNKKKRKHELVMLEEECTGIVHNGNIAETAEHQPTDESIFKKKRKKKHTEKSRALEEGQSKNTVLHSEESAETAEGHEQEEEGSDALLPTPNICKTKKKKKSSKANKDKSPAPETYSCCSVDSSTAKTEETADMEKEPSSQSKKRTNRKEELEEETEKKIVDIRKEKKKKKKHSD